MKILLIVIAIILGLVMISWFLLYRYMIGGTWGIAFTMFRAKPRIKRLTRRRGVRVRIEWIGAVNIDPRYMAIWLKTDRDFERDELLEDASLRPAIENVLLDVGYPVEAVPEIGLEIESQQTVDRKCMGSWYQAMH